MHGGVPILPVPPALARDRSHSNVRGSRRSSAPFAPNSSQRNVLLAAMQMTVTSKRNLLLPMEAAVEERIDGDNNGDRAKPAASNNATLSAGDAVGAARAEDALFPPTTRKKQERTNETNALIASLQANIRALIVLNRREQAETAVLARTIENLTVELGRFKEAYEEEKVKNEKIAALKKNRYADGASNYLPEIQSIQAAAAAAAAAAVQQQVQLEISYQRKLLSLENRYKDLISNNKKLVNKIHQLEKTEADADALIKELRQENIRLATQVDSLSSTIASQSSLIIGLRTTMQQLNKDEKETVELQRKVTKLQAEMDALKTRERLLREEHDKMKMVFSKEREAFTNKVVDFQHRLQIREQLGDDVEALEQKVNAMHMEKVALENELVLAREAYDKMETRMHEQELMTNRLLEANENLEQDRRELQGKVVEAEVNSLLREELQTVITELSKKDQEMSTLMGRVVALEAEREELLEAASRMKIEMNNAMQLSKDETVQALQLARQKAATHEALALVHEEKQALQESMRALEEQLATDKSQWLDEKSALEASFKAQISVLEAEIDRLRHVEPIIVEKPVPMPGEAEKREALEVNLDKLSDEYKELRDSFYNLDIEYKKLMTKKYKTESFQSQARLLQNENSELTTRLEEVSGDLLRTRAELNAKTFEIVDLKARVVDIGVLDMMRKTQESLEHTVGALAEAETASESTFTCLQCMRLFVDPLTLTPCGHTYCASCVSSFGNPSIPASIICKECATPGTTVAVFANNALADLTARFIFRQQSLSSLTTMCLSLRNSFANRMELPPA
ncbi:TPA: hypothetical protein N0F65_000009 [Lagenidium giganteum]|uniref:RING-type domain-containing protein n=1 Tax=Lagenidium giganteum TaxID=4803 RepID=A0AAV2YPY5_9STRA|nr:TPA: hypothetical protein N0F65_000009 [Lagenidium giganteum]